MNDHLKALLAPSATTFAIADGVSVRVRELSMKERMVWRAQCVNEDGSLSPDWVQHLLFLTVQDLNGNAIWESPDAVDGSEIKLQRLLAEVQRVNGLTPDAPKVATGN